MKQKVISLIVAGLLMVGVTGCRSSGSKKQTAEGPATQSTSAEAKITPETTAAETKVITTAEEKPKMTFENTDTSFDFYTNSIGSVEFYGIVEITNTGSTNIYMKDCTFDLEDNDGHLLQSESMFVSSCPSIIAPGEKGYFYNGIGANLLDKEVSTDNGLNLVPSYKLEEAKGEIVDYEISDTALRKDDYGNAKVTGRLTNNTDEDISLLYVNVLFKDASGKVLFITGTNVMDVSAGAKTSFEVSTMYTNDSVDFDSIADYEIIARKRHYQF